MTQKTIDEWDFVTKPILASIRIDAGWIIHYAKNIDDRLKRLHIKPDWPTEAEARLNEAIPEVETALLLLKQAREALHVKPVWEKTI